jgi:hypothetical protein
MAIPIISTTQGILGYKQFEVWNFQPGALNTPTSWAAAGLPAGLTIDGTTGLISCDGSTLPGQYVITVTATNGDGTSDPQTFFVGIEASTGSGLSPGGADLGIDLSVDVLTRDVTLVTSQPAAAAPTADSDNDYVFFAKYGDTVILNIRFYKDGVRIDPLLSSLKFDLKELEPDGALITGNAYASAPIKVGSGVTAVYQIAVEFTGDALGGALSNYEADAGTLFIALAEIEWKRAITFDGSSLTIVQASQTFRVRVDRDLIPA